MSLYGFLAVGAGATTGAWLRWALGTWLNPVFPTVPLGTLTANLLGGLIIGGVMSAADPLAFPPAFRLLVVTGFLGGLTTFFDFFRRDDDVTDAGALRLGPRAGIHACRWLAVHDHARISPHTGSAPTTYSAIPALPMTLPEDSDAEYPALC